MSHLGVAVLINDRGDVFRQIVGQQGGQAHLRSIIFTFPNGPWRFDGHWVCSEVYSNKKDTASEEGNDLRLSACSGIASGRSSIGLQPRKNCMRTVEEDQPG